MGSPPGSLGNNAPADAGEVTLHLEMPPEVVEVLRKYNLKIKLHKLAAARLIDQRPGLAGKDGCISLPSGPGC